MRIVFLLLCCISFVFSHKLNVFLSQENQGVFLNAYFASGSFCQNCKVIVKDASDKILEEGNTSQKGEYIITHIASKLFVSVDAGSGHFVTKTLELANQDISSKSENQTIKSLQEENTRLKSQIALLEEKNSQNELLRTLFALGIVVLIFMLLKRSRQ